MNASAGVAKRWRRESRARPTIRTTPSTTLKLFLRDMRITGLASASSRLAASRCFVGLDLANRATERLWLQGDCGGTDSDSRQCVHKVFNLPRRTLRLETPVYRLRLTGL